VLAVGRFATPKEIKSGYKTQALRWHPDKNRESLEASERFQVKTHTCTHTLTHTYTHTHTHQEQIKESAGLLDVIPWYLKTVRESHFKCWVC
jgi:preprotein translocase subunit Sec63